MSNCSINLLSFNHMPGHERFHYFYVPEPNSGCWLWLGCVVGDGYGSFEESGNKMLAHRYSWKLHNGRIPDGAFVCHHCDVPFCVNPNHLFLGDAQSNMDDKVRKGRHRGYRILTVEQVKLIRIDKRSQKDIAKSFGVSNQTISAIKCNTSWKHD